MVVAAWPVQAEGAPLVAWVCRLPDSDDGGNTETGSAASRRHNRWRRCELIGTTSRDWTLVRCARYSLGRGLRARQVDHWVMSIESPVVPPEVVSSGDLLIKIINNITIYRGTRYTLYLYRNSSGLIIIWTSHQSSRHKISEYTNIIMCIWKISEKTITIHN